MIHNDNREHYTEKYHKNLLFTISTGMPLNRLLAHVNVSLRTTYNYAVTLKLQKEISEIRKKDFRLGWRKRVESYNLNIAVQM